MCVCVCANKQPRSFQNEKIENIFFQMEAKKYLFLKFNKVSFQSLG